MSGRLAADDSLIAQLPARLAHHYCVFPVGVDEGSLVVAAAEPDDVRALDELRQFLQRDVVCIPAERREILEALKRHYGIGADTLESIAAPDSPAAARLEVEQLDATGDDVSVIKFVKQLLQEALDCRASDVHIEPYADELRIRRRIDGVLYEAKIPPSVRRFQSEIISRVKVLAGLDIAERRLPQDGRIQARVNGSDLDLRVSILPTPFGESVTIRLLTGRSFLGLERLGFFQKDMEQLESLLQKPHGIVLLTGPTGSGKTTTLYAFLNKINRESNKIITIEDPIEYQMRGVTQIQVQPKIGLDFAAGLRAMLRHDPDVMMVGEIRDLETAEIAIRVALTGHLVFSTLHTNDAPGAVTRLIDMGLEPFLVSSSLECVIAQRLVRLICAACARRGCEACSFTGYRGRTVIYEILNVTRDIRELILRRASADDIRRRALDEGMAPLRACGREKIAQGLTSEPEVLRATMKEER